MASAWDRLLDLVERLVADPETPIGPDVEQSFRDLCTEAIADRDVDGELAVDGVARWVTGLVLAHRTVRAANPEIDTDTELGELLRILTRWLHPARPR